MFPLKTKNNSLKKNFTFFLAIILFLSCCRKEQNFFIEPPTVQKNQEACLIQTENPLGRSYSSDSLIAINSSNKKCGLLSLNTKHYWVYLDSIFTDGIFTKIQYDTLRYIPSLQSRPDGLVWWKSSIYVGLPQLVFATDLALFSLEESLLEQGMKNVKKDFSLFEGDSMQYLTSFDDAAAMGRSIKLKNPYKVIAGSFKECIYVEKNARNYRRDQFYFKPEFGVVKYIQEMAPPGEGILKIQKILTLVSFHID